MAAPRIADQIGRVLGGRYRLVAAVGTGASADVFLADDAKLKRRVAVKVLHRSLVDDDRFLRRFEAEAQRAASLRHPHILQVYDWGHDPEGPYLVMEALSGGSLREALDRGGPLSRSQTVLLGIQAAEGLAYAHRRGIVHRDIKPANLLLDDEHGEQRLVIADFGVARALAEASVTEPGGVVGTTRYLAPEQAASGAVDGKADVYSLALTLIEAATGEVPNAGDSVAAMLAARATNDLEVPESLGPLQAALAEAGAVSVDRRIDAQTLARRLHEAAGELPRPAPIVLGSPPAFFDGAHADHTQMPPVAPPPDDITRIPESPAPVPEAPTDADAGDQVPPASFRRRRVRNVVIAVIALVALGAAGVGVRWMLLPAHPVPDLRGLDLAAAREEVSDEDFGVTVAREVFDEEVPAGEIIGQSPLPGESRKEGETIRVQVSKGPAPRAVPDLADITLDEARERLEKAGFAVEVGEVFHPEAPAGHVVDWNPRDGALHPKGSTVHLTISKGPEPREIPSFVGELFEKAKEALEALGFGVGRAEVFSDEIKAGQVVSSEPPAGAARQPGTEVVLRVSRGPETVAVPDLRGKTEKQAEEELRKVGLRLGDRFGPGGKDRKVFATSPSEGTRVRKGSAVDIYVRDD